MLRPCILIAACGLAATATRADQPVQSPRVIFDADFTLGSAAPGIVSGGQWDGGWRTTDAKDERIVFDAGRPIANGCLEVRVTVPRKPWGEGAAGKINWVGLHQDGSLSQNKHAGDLFYSRVGNGRGAAAWRP